jgi:hypothetical protein
MTRRQPFSVVLSVAAIHTLVAERSCADRQRRRHAQRQIGRGVDHPNVDALPMDAFGKTVRAGRDLIVHTAATIGPDAKDPAMRFSGNGLECQSCHLDAGTKKFGLPLAGVWGVFPQFIGRENEVRTLEERINGCLERSMNGRALPVDAPQMKAMLTYIRSSAPACRPGSSAEGRATPPLPLPTARRSETRRRGVRGDLRGVPSGGRAGQTLWGRATPRNGIATNSRRYGDPTATMTVPAWRGRSPRPISSVPTCHTAPPSKSRPERAGCVRRGRVHRQPASAASDRQRARLPRSRSQTGRRNISAVSRPVPAGAAHDRAMATDPAMDERQCVQLAKRLATRQRALTRG